MLRLLLVSFLLSSSPALAAGTGTITGKVTWKGALPKPAAENRASDPVCAKTLMTSDAVLVGKKGALRDVVVSLPNGLPFIGDQKALPATVTQKGCRYLPHVQVTMNRHVVVKNGDATVHNIHAYKGDVTVFNWAQPAGAPDLDRDLDDVEAGDVVRLKCDVHAWMEAFVVIVDHPFAAVTGDAGTFKLEHVPAGSYKLSAWHPQLGLQTADVVVKAGKKTQANFSYTGKP